MSFNAQTLPPSISTPSLTSLPSRLSEEQEKKKKETPRNYKKGGAVAIVERPEKKNTVDEVVRENRGCYCLVMTSALKSNRSTYILITSKPFRSVALHNRRMVYNRDTPNAAPYLFGRYSAGPFFMHETIVEFGDRVVHGGRGPDSKVNLVEELAALSHVECRDAHMELTADELREQFRRDGAPQSYFEELARVEASCAIIENYVQQQQQQKKVKTLA
jgi:hypothetical protein